MIHSAQSVIFDYDGTLVDTADALLQSINRALARTSLRSTTRREISGLELSAIISDRISEGGSQSTIRDVFDLIWGEFAETLSVPFPLRDGAAQTLETLSQHEIGLGLISKRGGRAGSLPLTELRLAGLENFFGFLKTGVGLKDYGSAITEALEKLDAMPKQTVVVSDWCKDIEYAKRFGLSTIGILGGVSDEDEHKSSGADSIVKSLSEIPGLICSQ